MNTASSSAQSFTFLFHLGLFYLMVLLLNGYGYGGGDMTETLSLVLHHYKPDALASDLYVSTMASNPIHERLSFVYLLSLGGVQPAYWALFLHVICSLLLFAGMYKITAEYIPSEVFRWAAVFVVVVGLQGIHLGGNDLYDLQFTPSFPAKALGVWSLFFFIKQRLSISVFLLVIAVLFQPLVAAQLLLLYVLTILIQLLLGQVHWEKRFNFAGLVALPLVLYILFLMNYHQSEPIETDTYFQIIHLRMDHHFFPDNFGLFNYLIYAILLGSSLIYFHNVDKRIFIFLLAVTGGCLLYAAGIHFNIKAAILTQWFKSTIWLEFLGTIAILAGINRFFTFRIPIGFFFSALVLILGIIAWAGWSPLDKKSYDLGCSWLDYEIVEIAEMAKEKTGKEALFILPPSTTRFRHVAERSVYVDFKSISHNTPYLLAWSERIKKVYGLDAFDGNPEGGFERIPEASNHYQQLSELELRSLHTKEGITHMLTSRAHELNFPIVAETRQFRIYRLDKTDR